MNCLIVVVYILYVIWVYRGGYVVKDERLYWILKLVLVLEVGGKMVVIFSYFFCYGSWWLIL